MREEVLVLRDLGCQIGWEMYGRNIAAILFSCMEMRIGKWDWNDTVTIHRDVKRNVVLYYATEVMGCGENEVLVVDAV